MSKIITDSYSEEVKKVKDIFQEDFIIPLDYSSPHNVVKDEIFLQFIKQINGNPKF